MGAGSVGPSILNLINEFTINSICIFNRGSLFLLYGRRTLFQH